MVMPREAESIESSRVAMATVTLRAATSTAHRRRGTRALLLMRYWSYAAVVCTSDAVFCTDGRYLS